MKKIIRLTESELHSLIANAVKKMVNEASGYIPRDGMTGGAWSYDHDSVQVDIYLDEILNSPSMDISEEEYDVLANALGGDRPMFTVNVDYENADDDAVGYFGTHVERVDFGELDSLEGIDPIIIDKLKKATEEYLEEHISDYVL